MSFNCKNDQGDPGSKDYKVFIVPPQPPSATPQPTSEQYCNIFSGTGQVSFQWTYNSSEGNDQSQYHLQIATDAGFSNLVVDSTSPQTVSPGGSGTSTVSVVDNPTPDTSDLDIDYDVLPGTPTTYYWQVQVQEDITGVWSEWTGGPSFNTPANAYPWPDFTMVPSSPSAGEIIQFTDQTTFYGTFGTESWAWDFENDGINDCWGPPLDGDCGTGDEQNPTWSYAEFGDQEVKLTATDSGGSCSSQQPLTISQPLPEWKEIAPVGLLERFLASISQFLKLTI